MIFRSLVRSKGCVNRVSAARSKIRKIQCSHNILIEWKEEESRLNAYLFNQENQMRKIVYLGHVPLLQDLHTFKLDGIKVGSA